MSKAGHGDLAAIVVVSMILGLAGCGGGEGGSTTAPRRPRSLSASYSPGDPNCRAREAPGTVAQIGEDVIGTRVSVFVACFGPPIERRRESGRRCLYYRDRANSGGRAYWEFCARDGRIVSALGSLPRPQ